MKRSTKADNDAVLALFHPVHEGPGWVGAMGEVTQFGGSNDPEDSGNTASGHSTKDHPNAPYCALPIPVVRRFGLKWGAPIYFQRGADGPKVTGFLWDLGPSTWTRRVADVGPVIMKALGGDGLLVGVRVTFKAVKP